jgi:hypothetical protein
MDLSAEFNKMSRINREQDGQDKEKTGWIGIRRLTSISIFNHYK